MSKVHLATVKQGQIQLINPVLLPEGTKILITVLESENGPQVTDSWEQFFLFEETSQQLPSKEFLDQLTKIGNRRYFDNYLVQSWQQQKARNQPIALILIDIDFFHPYNGKYGHQQGDNCLVIVAQCITNVPKRPMSAVARYGGEEFAVILPNTTIDDALIVAESIRNAVSSLAIPNSGYHEEVGSYLTISLGVNSLIPNEENDAKDLISQADSALYRAKKQGRDQVFVLDLDQLTQVDSRQSFDGYLEKVWQHSKRKQQFLSLILINIDYFKNYNDHFGHQESDKCLASIAQRITKVTKKDDCFIDDCFIARYSEDEFAVLLPDANLSTGQKA
jgi:diguanylate cyclase (GGDEF)-like protein